MAAACASLQAPTPARYLPPMRSPLQPPALGADPDGDAMLERERRLVAAVRITKMLVEPFPLHGIEFVVGVGVFSNRGVFGHRV